MGLIGTISDLLHARLVGQGGAPSPATGPDDRREVVASSPVDRIRPVVDRTDSLPPATDVVVSAAWAREIERLSVIADEAERVAGVIGAINVALDELDQAYARRQHGAVAQRRCVGAIRLILDDAGYRL